MSLELLEARGILDPLDREFADFIQELAGGDTRVGLAAALTSRALGQGDVCLDVELWAGQNLSPGHLEPLLRAPPLQDWLEALGRSRVVGEPGAWQPLILDAGKRLYLHRYWSYEESLAQALWIRGMNPPPIDRQRLRADLAVLFPGEEPDQQKLAAAVAVSNRVAVISGGPGTGKTTTLARVLTLLLIQEPSLRIQLAAPTGKAATRLQDAVQRSKQLLTQNVDASLLDMIPEEASTLHRLLGVRGDGMGFRHGPEQPLKLDLLAVDEASMVDLALMAHTVAALPANARLILLGDRDQLSSVEAGAVLGELCQESQYFSTEASHLLSDLSGWSVPHTPHPGPLADQVVLLSHSYRFAAGGGIGQLAGLIHRGDASALESLLLKPPRGLCWLPPPPERPLESLLELTLQGLAPFLQAVQAQAAPEVVFERLAGFQLLCPQRGGIWGVEELNQRLEEQIRLHLGATGREWYPGRALMVTRNDYTLRLFNGDVGIVLADPSQVGQLRAYFPQAGGAMRTVALSRLPPVEPVFAMTVHKSQGSEFDEVLLVLPEDSNASLSRELLYTAVTRARQRLSLWGEMTALHQAVQRQVRRASGLRERLARR